LDNVIPPKKGNMSTFLSMDTRLVCRGAIRFGGWAHWPTQRQGGVPRAKAQTFVQILQAVEATSFGWADDDDESDCAVVLNVLFDGAYGERMR
jgi:hypothetical protein